MNQSYLYSHVSPGKGASYDDYYRNDPWHRYLWSREKKVLSQILHEFFHERPAHLLDFACGTGRISSFLEAKVETATGVDVSEAMLEEARRKLSRTKLYNSNIIIQKPFGEASFNLITAFRFFANAEPQLRIAALNAIVPLLTKDGCFVFNIHNNTRSLYIRLAKIKHRLSGGSPDPNALKISACRDMLSSAGLQIERVYSVGAIHVPKINLPPQIYSLSDRMVCTDFLASFSESPVIVARRFRS